MTFTPEALQRIEVIRAALRIKEEQARQREATKWAAAPRYEEFREWQGFRRFAADQLRVVTMQKTLVPFRLNRMQRAVWAAELHARRQKRPPWFLILKYRKGGITTLQQALSYWTCWRLRHQECISFAHRPADTRLIFRMVSRFYDHQPSAYRHDKTPADVAHLEFPTWDSIYMAQTAGRGGGPRGLTLSRAHLSEAAHYTSLADVHSALAKALGQDSAYILETTPNGREGRGQTFHEFWEAAKKGQNDFTPLFFPWHGDPDNAIALTRPDELAGLLDPEADDLVKRFKLRPEQIKWWLAERRKIVANAAAAYVIHQEHPSDDDSCFAYGTDGYYDAGLVKEAERRCRDPLAVEDNGRLRIWEVPDKDKPATYSVGADPSGGTGGDDAAAVGINVKTGKQAFSYQYDRIAPDVFGEHLAILGRRWAHPVSKTPAYLTIEANNHGHATLTGVLKTAKYPRERVYHQTDEAQEGEHGGPKVSTKPGWLNTITGTADLTAIIGRMLRENDPKILDAAVIRSIRAVTVGKSGGEFTGRDLAVASGLAAIGMPYAGNVGGFMWIGGRVVDLSKLGEKAA